MDTLHFFKESIIDFKNTGSFLPSSNRLAKRLSRPIIGKPKLIIVELGAGTGSVTKYLLKILPKDSMLISLEINESLINKLTKNIHDPRLMLIKGDASKLGTYLQELNIGKVDYIVSGLPLGNFSRKSRYAIYSEICTNLKDNGIYTQFQYLLASFVEIRRIFSITDLAFEWRNMPPAFVYTCKLRQLNNFVRG
ncbi:MAG: methyltransferase domain-containing protein [Candidatus Paceibacterota bacterium]|jgi:phospholipid N-methyltransferase